MSFIRRHLTYANVVSTIALFLVLGGAAAFAATQLAKNSVGAKQLKKNAVTSAKLKNGSVTGAKLAEGSVSAGKLANGSVTAEKLAPGLLPGPVTSTPVVHHLSNATSLEFPVEVKNAQPVKVPLEHATFTQAAGEDDLIVASIEVHIPATCTDPGNADARLSMDVGHGSGSDEFLGTAFIEDEGDGDRTSTVQFIPTAPSIRGTVLSAPATATQHTFSVELEPGTCGGKAGVASNIKATGVQIDAIGFH